MAEPKQFYGRYHRVTTQIWTDPRFTTLPPTPPCSRYLYLWLLAGQEATSLPGVVIAGPMTIAEILDWELDETKTALNELVEAGLVFLDPRSRLIYVRRSLTDNPPANPNVITGWETSWSEIAPCALKEYIWAEFEAHAKARGGTFLASFLTACPGGHGLWNGSSNSSGNGPDNDFGNGSSNMKQNQPLYLSHKHSPEQNNCLGSGEVPSGFTSGESFRGNKDLGKDPVADPESDPGSDPGLATGNDPVLVQGHDLDLPRTMEDIDWDGDWPPAPVVSNPPAQNPEEETIPAAAKTILDAWNTRVALPDSVFEAVTGKDADKLAPVIMKTLQHPGAEADLQALFAIIPLDGFYSGGSPSKFVAFLRHYVAMDPDLLRKCGDIARNKLKKLKGKPGSKPMSKSEAEAKAARELVKTGPEPIPATNGLDARLSRKSK